MSNLKIGFIGAGNMAQALASGFIQAGKIIPENISCSSPSGGHSFLKNISNKVKATTDNSTVYKENRIVILAVKPQYLNLAIQQCHINNNAEHLIISIIAGINISQLMKALPAGAAIVRVVTNTPIIVRQGVSVYASNDLVSLSERQLVSDLFSCVGLCAEVPEDLMNSYGGLFGSGPAYVIQLFRSISQSMYHLAGLFYAPHAIWQTPGELKDMVCSPGGTTIAGVYELEKGGVRAALMSAVEASTMRSNELSRQFK